MLSGVVCTAIRMNRQAWSIAKRNMLLQAAIVFLVVVGMDSFVNASLVFLIICFMLFDSRHIITSLSKL